MEMMLSLLMPTKMKAHDMTNQNENVALLDSLQEHARTIMEQQEELHRAYMTSIQALLKALEARDPSTRGHSERVRAWSIRIARNLGLPDSTVDLIGEAACLHDVGKIGIRDAILTKKGPLSSEEWQVVRKHPLISVAILKPIKTLRSTLPIIGGHHERWDGKGYPDRLRGEAIPLGARIVAVADAYDALITDRPYRSGFKRPEAQKILREGASTQWDERVVAAFIAVQKGVKSSRSNFAGQTRSTIDPVCAMSVIPDHAPARALHNKHIIYFCSPACREAFEQNPGNYV